MLPHELGLGRNVRRILPSHRNVSRPAGHRRKHKLRRILHGTGYRSGTPARRARTTGAGGDRTHKSLQPEGAPDRVHTQLRKRLFPLHRTVWSGYQPLKQLQLRHRLHALRRAGQHRQGRDRHGAQLQHHARHMVAHTLMRSDIRSGTRRRNLFHKGTQPPCRHHRVERRRQLQQGIHQGCDIRHHQPVAHSISGGRLDRQLARPHRLGWCGHGA